MAPSCSRTCLIGEPSSAPLEASFAGPRLGPQSRPGYVPSPEVSGPTPESAGSPFSLLSSHAHQLDGRTLTVDSLQRKGADVLSVDWSSAAGHQLVPRLELRALDVDSPTSKSRSRSEPPAQNSTLTEVALAQAMFGTVPDSGRRRRVDEPLSPSSSKSELAKQAASFGHLDGSPSRKHFPKVDSVGKVLSPRSANRELESLDEEKPSPRQKRHWPNSPSQDALPIAARTWDFPKGAGTQAERRSFFEQSMLADVYAAKIGRPRLRAQPLEDEWRQTAVRACEHRRHGVRERGWRIVGSWHRSPSAMAAPLTHQLLLNALKGGDGHAPFELSEAPDDSDSASFNDSGPLSPRFRKNTSTGSVESTTASSLNDSGPLSPRSRKITSSCSATTASSFDVNRLHSTDDVGETDTALSSPWSPARHSPKLGDIAESHPASSISVGRTVPRELNRVVGAMVSGKEGSSVASAAGQALLRLRASGGLEISQPGEDASKPRHAHHGIQPGSPRKAGQWTPTRGPLPGPLLGSPSRKSFGIARAQ